MLLWLSTSVGAALCAVVIAVTLFRAERRARHSLYAALGVSDDLIPALMSQKGPVSAQMALVRQIDLTAPIARPEETRGRAEGLQAPAQRAFRFTRALNSARGAGRERPAVAPARRSSPLDRRES
jgi:hypothetical protein